MKKTANEIEADIYQLVKGSYIATAINGGVYRDELRPVNSQKEDAVISFMTGAFDTFRQEGKVNINIYIPDKESAGIKRKDVKRCREIERICQEFANNIALERYRFQLGRMIQTFKEPDINQHFVNLQFDFYYNFLKNK